MDKVLLIVPGFPFARTEPFFKKTWDCIASIKPGHTRSMAIAKKMGKPEATRAVASAIARNPIAYVIPCHRVIRANGHSGGYRWNPARKKMMLEYENLPLMNSIEHVVWDWNGTMDDARLCVDIVNGILSELSIPTVSPNFTATISPFPYLPTMKRSDCLRREIPFG